jgi:hypothetical protein
MSWSLKVNHYHSLDLIEVVNKEQYIQFGRLFGVQDLLFNSQNLQILDVVIINSLWDMIIQFETEAQFVIQKREKSVSDMRPTPSFTNVGNVFKGSMIQENKPLKISSKSDSLQNKDDQSQKIVQIGQLEFFSFNLLIKNLYKFDFKGRFKFNKKRKSSMTT